MRTECLLRICSTMHNCFLSYFFSLVRFIVNCDFEFFCDEYKLKNVSQLCIQKVVGLSLMRATKRCTSN